MLSSLCDKCEENVKTEIAEVEKGGVFWKCDDCNSEGIILAKSDLSVAVREHTGIMAPKHVGVTFTKEQCPICNNTEKEGNA